MAKKKRKAELVSVTYKIYCDKVNAEFDYEGEASDVHSDSWPCELCGSHGTTELNVSPCPGCGGFHDIKLSEW